MWGILNIHFSISWPCGFYSPCIQSQQPTSVLLGGGLSTKQLRSNFMSKKLLHLCAESLNDWSGCEWVGLMCGEIKKKTQIKTNPTATEKACFSEWYYILFCYTIPTLGNLYYQYCTYNLTLQKLSYIFVPHYFETIEIRIKGSATLKKWNRRIESLCEFNIFNVSSYRPAKNCTFGDNFL